MSVRWKPVIVPITSALTLGEVTLADPGLSPGGVDGGVRVGDGRRCPGGNRRSGHPRALIRDGDAVRGIVHVRDTLDSADSAAFAAPLARPVLELDRRAGV